MHFKKFGGCIAWAAAVLFFISFSPVFAATNISPTNHWAWNDAIGWVDFYSAQNVNVASTGLTGDASSSAGIISLDCMTHDACGSSSSTFYQVSNQVSNGVGTLAGWAWNDIYGWVSFCGGSGTQNCPGNITHDVTIDSGGNFQGYAWNDAIGWIDFNAGGTYPYEVQTLWVPTSTRGFVDSQTFDTGVASGAQLNSVVWRGLLPAGTAVGFQFATSSASSGPWNFTGPDGIPNSTSSYWGYNNSSPGSSIPLDYNLYDNARYFRYRVTLFSDTAQTYSPRVDDVVVNWSP